MSRNPPSRPSAPSDVRFQKISSKRSFENVVDQIRALIGSGQLREGDRLPPERELAAQFGVGRNTLREALRALENSGVLTLRKGASGGAFIHSGGGEAVTKALADLYRMGTVGADHLTEVRLILGREVARLACERRTEADMQALEANVQQTRDAALRGDHAARANINIEFHKLLAKATGNPLLVLITNALVEMVREFLQTLGAMPNEFAIESRERMLVHVRNRDAEAAVREMSQYLERAQEIYFARAQALAM